MRKNTHFQNAHVKNVSRSCNKAENQVSKNVNALKKEGLIGDRIVDLITEHGLSCANILEIESRGLNIDEAWINLLKSKGHGIVFVFPFVDINNILKRTAARRQEVQNYKNTISEYLNILENIVSTCVRLSNSSNNINLIIVNNNVESRDQELRIIINSIALKESSSFLLDPKTILDSLAALAGHSDHDQYTKYIKEIIGDMPDEWNTYKPNLDDVIAHINNIKTKNGGGLLTMKTLLSLARKYNIKGRSKMDRAQLTKHVSKYILSGMGKQHI